MYEVLLMFGPFTVTTISVLMATGFIAAILFLTRYIQLKKLNLRFFVSHFFFFLLAGFAGSRLLGIAEHFSGYLKNPWSVFYVWDLTLSPFGFASAIAFCLFWISRKEHEDFWAWLDAFVLSGLVALFFMHLGHFFNGSGYGKPTDLPWGVAFDTFNIPFTKPIHPTQLYSALVSFLLLGIGMDSARRTHLTGIAGSLALLFYSLAGLGIDFLHGFPSMYAKISFSAFAALGLIFLIHCSHRKMFQSDNQTASKRVNLK